MSSSASIPAPADGVSPFEVMALVREAARYPDAVHFEVGQPDLPPPPGVRTALRDLPDDAYGYTPSAGLTALRERIAAWYEAFYGIGPAVERIFVTPGSSAALMAAYWLTLGPGDRIVLADPSYPCYRNFARLIGAQTRIERVGAAQTYRLGPSHLAEGDRAVHILAPANPTGACYDPESLSALASCAKALGVRIISDELYHGLWYDRKPPTILAYDDDAIAVGGFSKSFCMPGFRLGWIVVPEALIDAMERLAQNLYLCAPTPMQYAALHAFDEAYLEEVRERFAMRRDWLMGRLKGLFGIPYTPGGAFYLWCDASEHTDDSRTFCYDLLRRSRVAVAPGIDFGESGRRFVRFAFTRDIDHMQEGIRRLEKVLGAT